MTDGTDQIELVVLSGSYYVCRLPPDTPAPESPNEQFFSSTRTSDELSVVGHGEPPQDGKSETGFCLLRVAGILDFSLVGLLARITSVLSNAGISVFCISTFDTDYILVRQSQLREATKAFRDAGMRVSDAFN